MPFNKVTSGLILFDDFAYSDGTLSTVGSDSWSSNYAVNNNSDDFQVVSGTVENDPNDNSGTNLIAIRSGNSYTKIAAGVLVNADDNDNNPTLTVDVDVGLFVNGSDEQPSHNYMKAYVRSTEFDQSVRQLIFDHRVSGSIVANENVDISSLQNFITTPARLKIYVEDSKQEVYFADTSVHSSTATHNNGIFGLPGLHENGAHFVGGFGRHDQFFACAANTVEVGSLVSGYQIKLNSKTATADSTGTATLDALETWFPHNTLEVLDATGASIDTLDVSSSDSDQRIFGGDAFTWTAPPAGDPWTDTTITSLESSLPWWVLWATTDSDYSTGVDYELRVQHINHLRISDETARAHLIFDSIISKP